MARTRTLVHVGDVHLGRDADVAQLEALIVTATRLRPDAIVVTGDLTQRARHGEFAAARLLVDRLLGVAPTLVVPGNHDIEWWASPFGVRGRRPLTAKYRRWFGEELTPVLEVPGVLVAGALTAHGLAAGSVTSRPRDLTVKGHFPSEEAARVRAVLARAAPGSARVVALHHNVLPGPISGRDGLAHPERARALLESTGADVVLCGHDHQETFGRTAGGLPVVTTGTLTHRTRGGRPSAFNLVIVTGEERQVGVRHFLWDARSRTFGTDGAEQWSYRAKTTTPDAPLDVVG